MAEDVNWYRERFSGCLEQLKTVETRDELDQLEEKIDEYREQLLSKDKDFREFLQSQATILKRDQGRREQTMASIAGESMAAMSLGHPRMGALRNITTCKPPKKS